MRYTHRVSVYRKRAITTTPFAEEVFTWDRLERDLPANIQGLDGKVVAGEMGPTERSTHWMLTRTGVDLRAGDGVQIDDGTMSGRRFEVEHANDWGRFGRVQANLMESEEDFTV